MESMKKLMTILLIAFCSCTNSGKLIGDKWPYSKGVIMTTSPTGLDGVTTVYNGYPTVPITVGTYSVTATITDWKALEKIDHDNTVLFFSIVGGILLTLFLIGWTFGRKDETIKIPDEEPQYTILK